MGGLQGYAVERRDALSSGLLELVGELPGVVRDQRGAVSRTADRHVEGLLGSEPGVVRGHGGDDPVHRPALERVHGRRPGPVKMAELGIAVGEPGRRSVLQAEAHTVVVRSAPL